MPFIPYSNNLNQSKEINLNLPGIYRQQFMFLLFDQIQMYLCIILIEKKTLDVVYQTWSYTIVLLCQTYFVKDVRQITK